MPDKEVKKAMPDRKQRFHWRRTERTCKACRDKKNGARRQKRRREEFAASDDPGR